MSAVTATILRLPCALTSIWLVLRAIETTKKSEIYLRQLLVTLPFLT
jgi:hypothetical protein